MGLTQSVPVKCDKNKNTNVNIMKNAGLLNEDKLLKVVKESDTEDMDLGCDCDGETTVKVESEIFIYEGEESDYQSRHVTETCTVCGVSRDYILDDTFVEKRFEKYLK